MSDFLTIDIQGFKADLPILPLPSGVNIAFFNLHGAVDLTEHCGKKLAAYLGDCINITPLREKAANFICRTESEWNTARP